MKKKILALTMLAYMGVQVMAQEENNITGMILDRAGNPVSGAARTTR